ncbi:conserved hypothetical protein [Frankia canadensis]|uniref:DUF2795 domain-containing protein n=1 Tax=Frankia canadensis TaxID=1836972 RepID=A0A2I2KL46_9ACTN|nr:DUF2795 domain-containing protein [Frankia canadensis]SNQ46383.1 conserved hypothetical protein [Frankia canadensis]SOU53673.1 conserved hypothetical protein [Frankia canadensis]
MVVDRGSSKHGPLRDEIMAHETVGLVRSGRDTRLEEWRSTEPTGERHDEDTAHPDAARLRAAPASAATRAASTAAGSAPAGMTPLELDDRSELARWLGRAVFPAEREEIMDHLRHQHAPDWAVGRVAAAPPDVQFTSVGELWRAMRSASAAY